MRPHTWRCVQSQKDISGKKCAEEHHFGCEKQPDADLGVPEAGVGTSRNCVWNFHSPGGQTRTGSACRLAASALRWLYRFVLHRVIAFAPRKAIFVRAAISDRRSDKVSVRRRRRRSPLQRGRFPRIVVHFFAVLDAPEEINDERNLGETHDPGRPRDGWFH